MKLLMTTAMVLGLSFPVMASEDVQKDAPELDELLEMLERGDRAGPTRPGPRHPGKQHRLGAVWTSGERAEALFNALDTEEVTRERGGASVVTKKVSTLACHFFSKGDKEGYKCVMKGKKAIKKPRGDRRAPRDPRHPRRPGK